MTKANSKLIFSLTAFLLGGILAYGIFYAQNPSFEKLSPEEMHEQIIEQRDFAIRKAVSNGDYECCIQPPCTMCYLEANQWNHQQVGTCACDDFIAQGKKPCPQCVDGLCEGESSTCNFKPADTQ